MVLNCKLSNLRFFFILKMVFGIIMESQSFGAAGTLDRTRTTWEVSEKPPLAPKHILIGGLSWE